MCADLRCIKNTIRTT